MKTIRSFLAINLSLATARRIESLQRDLREKCDAAGLSVRWVPPQNIHVTLRFLGSVTEPMIQAVKDTMESLADRTAPFAIDCSGLGTFEKEGAPVVLWARVTSPDEGLMTLHLKMEDTLEETGFKKNDDAFVPHVTLGRITGETGPALEEILSEYRDTLHGSSQIKDLLCYRSDLKTNGTDYHLLWRLSLGGRGRPVDRKDNPQEAPSSAREQD